MYDLIVDDVDNNFPFDFTLTTDAGENIPFNQMLNQ